MMSDNPQIHKIITCFLLLGLLPVELVCFFMAWVGYTRDIEDFIAVGLMHWVSVMPMWLILRRLCKHNHSVHLLFIALLCICVSLMSLLLVNVMTEVSDWVREAKSQDRLDAQLWLAVGLLAQTIKLGLLMLGAKRILKRVFPHLETEYVAA